MISPDWPALPFEEWESTCDTLHLWTQIVGKTRMTLTPRVNHWWNVPLYVTSVGLTTSAIPCRDKTFEVAFDFVRHCLDLRTSDGRQQSIPLVARSDADFYAEYMSSLRSLGIEVKFNRIPVEFDDPTPFDEDRHHASYDKEYVERFNRILLQADRILKKHRTALRSCRRKCSRSISFGALSTWR